MNILNWVENWYNKNCDGYWEHEYGISIDTLDNPGWHIKINLEGTSLERKNFKTVKENISDNDWYVCEVKDNCFIGVGDSKKLSSILLKFKEWTEA